MSKQCELCTNTVDDDSTYCSECIKTAEEWVDIFGVRERDRSVIEQMRRDLWSSANTRPPKR